MKERSSHKVIWFELAGLLTLLAFAVFWVPQSHSTAQQDNRQLSRDQAQQPNRSSEHRLALVIGNGAYTKAPPLKNPPNDARDMAATLKTLGFDVTSGINVNQRDMKRLIREFGQKLKEGGSGLFYYAGHGVQSKGKNYLIPIEADIQSEIEVEDAGVDVNLVLGYMDDAQNGLNIVILDACRNNPFARSFRSAANGLAQVDAPTGTLIAYATAPGRVASDGNGQNGLYTSELLKQMQTPGVSITDMFMRVRGEVMKQTGNKQVPWEASSLVGSFYFSGGANATATNTGTNNGASGETKFDAAAFEYNYWDSIKNSTSADDFKAYLAKYPEGQFSSLAKNRIKKLEEATKPTETEPTSRNSGAAEIAFWDSIKNSTSAGDFKAYLEKYPNGEFAALAKSRLAPLEAAEKEKEKADEATRLEAEATKLIKTIDLRDFDQSSKIDGRLYFFKNRFGVGIGGSPFNKEAVEQFRLDLLKIDMSKECQRYQRATLDGVWILGLSSRKAGHTERYRFQSAAEAAEALAEIQRICKANP